MTASIAPSRLAMNCTDALLADPPSWLYPTENSPTTLKAEHSRHKARYTASMRRR